MKPRSTGGRSPAGELGLHSKGFTMKVPVTRLVFAATLVLPTICELAFGTRAWGSEPAQTSPVSVYVGDAEEASWDRPVESRDAACSWSCAPRWQIGGGVLLLERSTPDSLVLMRDTTDPTRNLNADDFDFDWEAGWELSLARRLSNNNRLEARVMSVDSWNAPAVATTNSTLLNPLRINTNPPTTAPEVQTIDASYGSDLQGLEVNYILDDRCWNWLVGFRYIELDEQLQANLNALTQVHTYDVGTRNRMYGIQAGGSLAIWSCENWSIDGVLKAGVFYNSQGHSSVLRTSAAAQTAVDAADRTAFAGELCFAATYDVTDRLALRFGYEMLWLETVALASDQIPGTDLFTETGIVADGGVFYHGAFVGLEHRH